MSPYHSKQNAALVFFFYENKSFYEIFYENIRP